MIHIVMSQSEYKIATERIAFGWTRHTNLFLKYWIRYLLGR